MGSKNDIWKKKMIIDGGMGTELTRCGAKQVNSHRLWSAIVNINQPEIVVEAHKNFINAGADIVISNSYKVNVPLYQDALGINEENAIKGTLAPIKFAKSAKEACKNNTIIAGGIGPLPDRPMCEFHPDYLARMSRDELLAWHEPRFKLYYESECDILALETIPGTKEIEALMILLKKYPKDAYLSLACCFHGDERLNSGEKWEHALQLIKKIAPPSLKGIGINCTKPHLISKFGYAAKTFLPDLTLIVYPNSGEEWHANLSDGWSGKDGEWVGERRDITHYIPEWKEIGFQWFGGCCRVTPEEITEIRKAVFAD